MTSNNTLAATVADLRNAKDASGLAALADTTIEAVRAGLRSTWAGKLDTIEAIKAIIDESLFHFAKMDNGKPYAGWKPLVKAIFKAETAEWDKATRNSWAVTLVDLGMSHDEAGDALNTSKATVQRACADAELEAQGIDPEEARKAKRAAQGTVSDAQKLIDKMSAAILTLSDQSKWTRGEVLDAQQVATDFAHACGVALSRRDGGTKQSEGGANGRTGTKTGTKVA